MFNVMHRKFNICKMSLFMKIRMKNFIHVFKKLGLQNRLTGWVTPVDNNLLLTIISQFDRYKLPVLILK